MQSMVTLTDIDYLIYVWSVLLCSNDTNTLKKQLMLNEVKVKLLLLIRYIFLTILLFYILVFLLF